MSKGHLDAIDRVFDIPGCPAFIPISTDFGFCPVHEHHVYLDPAASRCLCSFCTTDAGGKRHLDRDVYFYNNFTIGLHSKDKMAADARRAEAAKTTGHVDVFIPVAPRPALAKIAKPVPVQKPRSLFDFK